MSLKRAYKGAMVTVVACQPLGLDAILKVDHPASYKKVLNEPIRENLITRDDIG